jgi:hypothetical protein
LFTEVGSSAVYRKKEALQQYDAVRTFGFTTIELEQTDIRK